MYDAHVSRPDGKRHFFFFFCFKRRLVCCLVDFCVSHIAITTTWIGLTGAKPDRMILLLVTVVCSRKLISDKKKKIRTILNCCSIGLKTSIHTQSSRSSLWPNNFLCRNEFWLFFTFYICSKMCNLIKIKL